MCLMEKHGLVDQRNEKFELWIKMGFDQETFACIQDIAKKHGKSVEEKKGYLTIYETQLPPMELFA